MRNQLMETLRAWWHGLAERERITLSIGGVLVVLFVLYSGIWSPLSSSVENYRADVKDQRALLLFLQNASDRITKLRAEGVQAATAPAVPIDLLTLSEQTLSAHQLSPFLKNVSQKSDKSVVLTFEKAPMDKLMGWLQQMLTTENVRLISMIADRQSVIGTADVTMTLKKPKAVVKN